MSTAPTESTTPLQDALEALDARIAQLPFNHTLQFVYVDPFQWEALRDEIEVSQLRYQDIRFMGTSREGIMRSGCFGDYNVVVDQSIATDTPFASVYTTRGPDEREAK